MSARSSSLSACSAGSTSSPSRSAIDASSFAASARRSPRCAASTSASVSSSEAAFISTCSSDSCREQARISSAIASPSPSLADHLRFDPLDPGADRSLRRGSRRGGGANVVEQLLAGGDALAQRLAVALAEQALGAARVARGPLGAA